MLPKNTDPSLVSEVLLEGVDNYIKRCAFDLSAGIREHEVTFHFSDLYMFDLFFHLFWKYTSNNSREGWEQTMSLCEYRDSSYYKNYIHISKCNLYYFKGNFFWGPVGGCLTLGIVVNI